MAYLGNSSTQQSFTPAIDYFNGDGSTTAFTLSRPVASVAQIQVTINNVAQNPSSAYTVNGSTITFTSAPLSGSNNIYVYYTSPNTQVIAPSQGTVFPTSLSTGGLYWNTSGNVGIGTSSPAYKLDVIGQGRATTGFAVSTDGSTFTPSGLNAIPNYGVGYITSTSQTVISGFGGIPFYTNQVERMRLDSSGNLLFNSGYGSVATAYGCRAWVQFNGSGTVTINSSGNVTSITDNGVGNYTLTFTNNFPDTNYALNFGICSGSSGLNAGFVGYVISATQYGLPNIKTANTCQIGFGDYTATPRDFSQLYVTVFR